MSETETDKFLHFQELFLSTRKAFYELQETHPAYARLIFWSERYQPSPPAKDNSDLYNFFRTSILNRYDENQIRAEFVRIEMSKIIDFDLCKVFLENISSDFKNRNQLEMLSWIYEEYLFQRLNDQPSIAFKDDFLASKVEIGVELARSIPFETFAENYIHVISIFRGFRRLLSPYDAGRLINIIKKVFETDTTEFGEERRHFLEVSASIIDHRNPPCFYPHYVVGSYFNELRDIGVLDGMLVHLIKTFSKNE